MRRLSLLLFLVALLLSGCTESVIPYDVPGQGGQLPELDVEVGKANGYLLMDYDQSTDPTEHTATDAHSHDPRIADVERTDRDASAGQYEHGRVFLVYGHVPGETDLDVYRDDHLVGTVHVRVTSPAID